MSDNCACVWILGLFLAFLVAVLWLTFRTIAKTTSRKEPRP